MLLGSSPGGAEGADLLAALVRLVAHRPVPAEPAADRHLVPADADLHDLQLLAVPGSDPGTGSGLLLLRLEQEESRRERVLSLDQEYRS